MSELVSSVPANVITGFLGVGKTTAIRHLLQSKPAGERWAVLVNEFGEVGVDGGLLEGDQNTDDQVFIKEVPGGCMCCAAGLPMQVALTQLLHRSKPDRLLIEPTGLGHPQEVLSVLNSEAYQGVLDVKATLTLVDARKIKDERYRQHDIFNQQLLVADHIVATKSDLYDDDLEALTNYLSSKPTLSDKRLSVVEQGAIELDWLEEPSDFSAQPVFQPLAPVETSGGPGIMRMRTASQPDTGFVSSGWVFEPKFEFDPDALFALFSGLAVERLKAVMITSEGINGYNLADGVLTIAELDEAGDSRVEVIAETESAWGDLEAQLTQAIAREC